MTRPRSTLASLSDTPWYHVVCRCVRRAYLCGDDALTGQSHDHRRGWIVERVKQLAGVFAIDVAAYAVMSNHYHLVLRVDAERAQSWCREEVLRRWTQSETKAETKEKQKDTYFVCALCDMIQGSPIVFPSEPRLPQGGGVFYLVFLENIERIFVYNNPTVQGACIMSAITFDTHKFVRKLKESGFDEKQAEALTDAMQDAIADSELVTKRDLQIELAPIRADMNLLKWMLGAVLAIAIANFAKQFF